MKLCGLISLFVFLASLLTAVSINESQIYCDKIPGRNTQTFETVLISLLRLIGSTPLYIVSRSCMPIR